MARIGKVHGNFCWVKSLDLSSQGSPLSAVDLGWADQVARSEGRRRLSGFNRGSTSSIPFLLHFQSPSTSSDASEVKATISLEEAPSSVDQGRGEFPPVVYPDAGREKGPARKRRPCFALVSERRQSCGRRFLVGFHRHVS
jgi:hypothetical protein